MERQQTKKILQPKRIFWELGIVLLLILAILTFKIPTNSDSTSNNISSDKEQERMQSLPGVFSNVFVVEHTDGADNGQAQLGAKRRGGSLDWDKNNARDRSQSMQKIVHMFSGSFQVSTYLWDTITRNRVRKYLEGDLEDGYILDAIWVSPKNGPGVSYSQAVENNMILASTDPIALDYWAAKNILMKVAKKESKPYTDPINPGIIARGSFGYWLRLSMNELNKSGYKTTLRLVNPELYQ